MTPQELAKEIILTHAKKHHFEYEWLFKKWGKKGVKMYNGIHLDHHKQILTLYIKDNIEIPHTHLAKLLGYRDHSVIIHNLKKFRFLFQQNDDNVHNRYADIAEWADKLLDLYTPIGKHCKN